MDTELLTLFVEFHEKQDIVQKQTTKSFLHGYGHSELHCIDAIGSHELPNVTLISHLLSVTKGAVSKIIKRLLARGDITYYQLSENKKEIYYALTEKGRHIYDAHRQRHQIWAQRDNAYLKGIPEEDKEVVGRFLKGFNQYLGTKIEELDRLERGSKYEQHH